MNSSSMTLHPHSGARSAYLRRTCDEWCSCSLSDLNMAQKYSKETCYRKDPKSLVFKGGILFEPNPNVKQDRPPPQVSLCFVSLQRLCSFDPSQAGLWIALQVAVIVVSRSCHERHVVFTKPILQNKQTWFNDANKRIEMHRAPFDFYFSSRLDVNS